MTTRTVPASIAVPINAAFGGVTRTAALGVLTAPVLKIARIRILSFGTEVFDSALDTGFLPGRSVFLLASQIGLREVAILVDFTNAQLDPASVVLGTTFNVARPNGTPVSPSIVNPGRERDPVAGDAARARPVDGRAGRRWGVVHPVHAGQAARRRADPVPDRQQRRGRQHGVHDRDQPLDHPRRGGGPVRAAAAQRPRARDQALMHTPDLVAPTTQPAPPAPQAAGDGAARDPPVPATPGARAGPRGRGAHRGRVAGHGARRARGEHGGQGRRCRAAAGRRGRGRGRGVPVPAGLPKTAAPTAADKEVWRRTLTELAPIARKGYADPKLRPFYRRLPEGRRAHILSDLR